MQGIYLDHNATCELTPGARIAWEQASRTAWGNPNSAHGPGLAARRLLEASRSSVADLVRAKPSEVVFTSGGTEANVMALRDMVVERRGEGQERPRLLVGATEHSSVLEVLSSWEAQGDVGVVVLPVMETGEVDLDALSAALPDADGLCLMWANNETGVLNPLEEIGRLVQDRGIPWHCDAIQGVGRLPVPDLAGVRSLAISAHKIGGPKGCGALVTPGGNRVAALMPVPPENRDGRAGTPDVPAAAAFAAAAREALDGRPQERWGAVWDCVQALESLLAAALPEAVFHGRSAPRLPNTCSVALGHRGHWVDGDEMAAELAVLGVQVATGAACGTDTGRPSHVLTAMGVSPEQSLATLRLSLGREAQLNDTLEAGRLIIALVERQQAESGLSPTTTGR